MKWIRLHDYKGVHLGRSAVFRFQATWPYENTVELMLCEGAIPDLTYFLLVSTGYKSGLIHAVLPEEAHDRKVASVNAVWLKKHWRKSIYDISTKEVLLCVKGRAKPTIPEVNINKSPNN